MTATTDRPPSDRPPSDRSPQRRSPLADEHATPTRRQRRRQKAQATRAFWGTTGREPAVTARPIRPTHDPAAIPRSLGDPPLAPELAPQQQLAVVYGEAVRAAVALAAANDLLDHTAED
jgi:hypothetical protein